MWGEQKLEENIQQAEPYFAPILIGTLESKIKSYLGKKGKLKNGVAGVVQRNAFKDRYSKEYNQEVRSQLPRLYKIYQNSLHGGDLSQNSPCESNLKILGSEDIRDKHIAVTEQNNFGILNDSSQGCILNTNNWNLLVNDVVILGAIHSLQDFAVWSLRWGDLDLGNGVIGHGAVPMTDSDGWPTIDDDILWDAKENRPRVAGRELLMLHAAGYELVDDQNLGMYFVNTDPQKVSDLTLTKICEVASKADLASIKAYLQR